MLTYVVVSFHLDSRLHLGEQNLGEQKTTRSAGAICSCMVALLRGMNEFDISSSEVRDVGPTS